MFGPAEDGGYVLIGAARSPLQLFEGIAWGTSTVMQATRARLARGNWRWRELGLLWDLDRPEDLLRWRQLRAEARMGRTAFYRLPCPRGQRRRRARETVTSEVPTNGIASRTFRRLKCNAGPCRVAHTQRNRGQDAGGGGSQAGCFAGWRIPETTRDGVAALATTPTQIRQVAPADGHGAHSDRPAPSRARATSREIARKYFLRYPPRSMSSAKTRSSGTPEATTGMSRS